MDTNPISRFNQVATSAQIERTVKALEEHNIHVIVSANSSEAKKKAIELIPLKAEVFTATSITLTSLGITEELDKSGLYNSIRAELAKMDPKTQNREMQKMGATPEYMIGSVHAVTESGQVIIAS